MACLWEKYENNEQLHVHCSDNVIKNTFEDGLMAQWFRIKANLMKALPEKTEDEVIELMRFGEET